MNAKLTYEQPILRCVTTDTFLSCVGNGSSALDSTTCTKGGRKLSCLYGDADSSACSNGTNDTGQCRDGGGAVYDSGGACNNGYKAVSAKDFDACSTNGTNASADCTVVGNTPNQGTCMNGGTPLSQLP